jgi:hypothetical protein
MREETSLSSLSQNLTAVEEVENTFLHSKLYFITIYQNSRYGCSKNTVLIGLSILDNVRRPVSCLKEDVSETEFWKPAFESHVLNKRQDDG